MRMLDVRQTAIFEAWLSNLRDQRAVARITVRIARFRTGNLGDVKAVGGGVSEAKIDYGPGYRLYFAIRNGVVVILLCGGDKNSQRRDIAMAKRLAAEE
jgi:putative addiction module killer protein